MNQLIYIRETIYSLKMDYGVPLAIYQMVSSNVNLKTGRKTVEIKKFPILKAIALPKNLIRRIVKSVGGDFKFGGFEDQNIRTFIIDSRDYPADYIFKHGDYLILDDTRYNLKTVENFENRLGVLVQAEQVIGERAQQIIEKNIETTTEIQTGAVRED